MSKFEYNKFYRVKAQSEFVVFYFHTYKSQDYF